MADDTDETRLTALDSENAALRDQADRYRSALEDLRSALAESQGRVQIVTAALDEADTDFETMFNNIRDTPDEKDMRIAALEAEVRTGRHKSEFAKAARAAGVREDAVDDLFTALDYKSVGEPNAEKLEALLTAARTSKAWAWAADANPSPRPVPGAGRGGRHTGTDGTIITRQQLADPTFMLNPANQEVIRQAAREHRFRG